MTNGKRGRSPKNAASVEESNPAQYLPDIDEKRRSLGEAVAIDLRQSMAEIRATHAAIAVQGLPL
jgi:hypothetical protein